MLSCAHGMYVAMYNGREGMEGQTDGWTHTCKDVRMCVIAK